MSKNLSPKNSNDKRVVNRQKAAPAAKPLKRENTFSKSRDVREDRGLRQIKTIKSPQRFHMREDVTFMKHNHNHDNAPSPVTQPALQPVRFEFTHPTAITVCVAGTFNNWQPQTKPMQSTKKGSWLKETSLAPGTYEYCLVVDGQFIPDPLASETVPNPFGGLNSVLKVPHSVKAAHRIAATLSPLNTTHQKHNSSKTKDI